MCGMGTALAQPLVTNALVPTYMQGTNGTNNNRTSFFFWVELSGLTPGATYRFYTSMDTLNASPTSNGAGNSFLLNVANDTVRRTTSVSLSNAAGYEELIADGAGTWKGWMGVEPTGNPRFTTGNTVYPKIIMNAGNGTSTVAHRVFLTNHPIQVLNYGTNPQAASEGSFLYDSTTNPRKTLVFLYDITVPGSVRPVASAIVEKDGVDLVPVTSVVSSYRTAVDSFAFRWGTIIPNNLTNGIRRVEYRDFATGTATDSILDADGLWCFANTVDPGMGNSTWRLRSLESLPVPSALVLNSPVCANDNAQLSYTSGFGPVSWYSDSLSTQLLGTGTPFSTAPLDTIWFSSDSNGCVSPVNFVTMTVVQPFSVFEDADGDGYGDLNAPASLCDTTGYVSNSLDCDDADANVNPGQTEICFNGVDDDCDPATLDVCGANSEMDISESGNPFASGGTYSFGTVTVGASANATFTVENTGSDTLYILSAPVYTGPFSGTALPATIAPGGNFSWVITATPVSAGSIAGSVSVTSSDLDENPYVINFSLNAVLGIENPASSVQTSVFPVPAQDVLHVQTSEAVQGTIRISDVAGKSILTQNMNGNQATVPVENLQSGLYFLQILDANNRVLNQQSWVKD